MDVCSEWVMFYPTVWLLIWGLTIFHSVNICLKRTNCTINVWKLLSIVMEDVTWKGYITVLKKSMLSYGSMIYQLLVIWNVQYTMYLLGLLDLSGYEHWRQWLQHLDQSKKSCVQLYWVWCPVPHSAQLAHMSNHCALQGEMVIIQRVPNPIPSNW